MQWGLEKVSTCERATELARQASFAFGNVELDQDVSWLYEVGRARGETVVALTARERGKLVGLAPFATHRGPLKIAVGGVSLWRKDVQRYEIDAGPLIVPEAGDAELPTCFQTLAEELPTNAVVFLRGVAQASPLHRALGEARLRQVFNVVPHGPVYRRCRIRWEGDFEAYLSSLGKVSRKDLRRTLRKAPEILGVQPRLSRYTRRDDVEPFIAAAASVSAKTYQAKLGVGLRAVDRTRGTLEAAALSGRLLGHVLFRDEEPIAFHLGFVHGERFYMANGGYDPAWARAQAGMFTFLKVLQDLEADETPVLILDYLYGDGPYKLRTSNVRTPERHYYLTPRTAEGAVLAVALRATDGLSRSAGVALDKLGLKDEVKAILKGAAAIPDSVITRLSPPASTATTAVMNYMPLVAVV